MGFDLDSERSSSATEQVACGLQEGLCGPHDRGACATEQVVCGLQEGPCGPHDRGACEPQAYPCGPQGVRSVSAMTVPDLLL